MPTYKEAFKKENVEATHRCASFDDESQPDGWYGPAIGVIVKVGGVWLTHNDEYATLISYCPFCGVKLD